MADVPSLRFRLFTLLTAFAAWALVAVGGVVRATGSGLGCPHWPLCTSRALPLDQQASVIEYSHRVLVALVSTLAVVLALWAWRGYSSRRAILWPALVALAIIPAQALLGALAVWRDLEGWVVAVHFVVGLLLLATIVLVAAEAWRPSRPTATVGFARLARAGVVVGLALVSVGAAVVASNAEDACGTQWPRCNGGFASGGGLAQLQVAHRMLAYTVALMAFALLVLALRGRGPRPASVLLVMAVLLQVAFGIAFVLVGPGGSAAQALEALHVGGAGAVWASLVALAALARPSTGRAFRHAGAARHPSGTFVRPQAPGLSNTSPAMVPGSVRDARSPSPSP